MSEMTGARCVAETLGAYRVTHVFFVPTMLMSALAEMETRTEIVRVMTHGEKAAAYMADGYARASGRTGVCMAQNVGAANLAAGLRDAWMAGSPVLALTGGPYPHTRGRPQYQEANDLPLFAPLTKFSTRVESVARFPDLFRQAFRVATSGRPGPVHLEFEGHLGEHIERQTAELEVSGEDRFTQVPPFRPEPEPDAVVEALRLLAQAKRPVIVAGGGVRASDAREELRVFAESLAIPVATSGNGKDAIPGNHPLAVGVAGVYARQSANKVLLEADLVFYIGSPAGSLVSFHFQIPRRGQAKFIQLDIDPEQLGRSFQNDVSLLGDAKATLARLIDAAKAAGATPEREEWLGRVRAIDSEWREEYAPLLQSSAEPIRPERLCSEIQGSLPSDAILVSDTGHSAMWTGGMIDLSTPGQRYLRAAGSLGWGLPASIGAKCAAPDQAVVLFTGDGGLWYHIAEIETAVRKRLGVVVVVNDNRSLNQEVPILENVYGGALHGNHEDLWYFEEVDFARHAETLGAKGMRVTKPTELAGALASAVEFAEAERRPVVVDVVTDIEAMARPLWPFRLED